MADNRATFTVDVETAEGRRNLVALVAALKQLDAELEDVGKGIADIGDEFEDTGKKMTALERVTDTLSVAKGTFWGNMASKAVSAIKEIGQAFVQMGRDFVTSSVQIGIERDALQLGIAGLLGSAEAGAIALERLKQAALKPGVTFEEAVRGFTRLIASGAEANAAVETIEALGRAATASGAGAQELGGAIYALSQMFGKGTVQAEELRRQLLERLPAVAQALQHEFGTTSAEAIMKLCGTVEEFRARMVKAINETIPEIASLKNEIVNLKDVWLSAKEAFGRGLIGDEAAGQVTEFAELIRELNPMLEDLGEKAGTAAQGGLSVFADRLLIAKQEGQSFLDVMRDVALEMGTFIGPGGWLRGPLALGIGAYQRNLRAEGIRAVQPAADVGLEFIKGMFTVPPVIPDERDLSGGVAAVEDPEAAAKKAEAEAVARVRADIARNTAAKRLATARGDFGEAVRLERLIAEGQVTLSQTTRTTLDDETGTLTASAMVQELENKIAERARREAD